ncbi:MAG TPA: DUF5691 domain-containing protein [Thermoanaerobaculia bacterium]|nr:DUF5691 domain-containing protein [Thermoanaerobaculia bacterium]
MTDAFVRAALVGTARDANGARATGTAVDALFRDDDAFLLRAGARDVYIRAGLRPQRRSDAIEAALPETLRRPSPALTDVLAEAIGANNLELLYVMAEALDEAGLHLPHALLPGILGTRDRQLRSALAPIAGERGRWLARRNPAWSWLLASIASGDAATQWEEGSEQQAADALRAMRLADPAAAREQLEARLPKEKADTRAAMLMVLLPTLSPDDEPLLERALDDRSSAVKAIAADLLARLPGSAFVQRMQARLEPAVRFERKLLVQRVLVVEPPAELDAAATRDVIPSRTPQGTGTRAYAWAQIAGAVPLSFWSRFGLTPQQLLDAAAKSEWHEALVSGWILAAARQRDAAWSRTLLPLAKTEEELVALARALPPAELMQLLASLGEGRYEVPLAAMLALLPRPWPRAFAHGWLQRLRRAAAQRDDSSGSVLLAATAELTARGIPAELFAIAAEEWTLAQDSWSLHEWAHRHRRFQQIIRIRKAVAEETRT